MRPAPTGDRRPQRNLAATAHAMAARWAWTAFLSVLVAAGVLSLLRGGGMYYFGAANSDLMCYFYPWRVFVTRWLHRGIFPFWDPHVFDGYPVLEVQQMALLYPPSLFSAMALPARLDLLVTTAMHLVLAAAGLCFSIRHCFRVSRACAVVAAITYVYGATFAMRVCAGHLPVLYAMAWMPIATLATFRSSCHLLASPRQSRTLRRLCDLLRGTLWTPWFLVAALSNAMAVLVGSPQYVVYLFWCEVVVALAVLGPRRWRLAGGLLAMAWTLAAFVSCPLWLPTLYYLPFSSRSVGSGLYFSGWLDRADMLIELVLPFPFGDDLRQPHLHMKNVWETCSYAGTITLILALALSARVLRTWVALPVHLLRRRWARGGARVFARLPDARMRASFGLLVLAFYLCWAGWLPGFSHFREPQKARAILTLALSLCAALQLNRIEGRARLAASVLRARVRVPWLEMAVATLLGGFAFACQLHVRAHPDSFVNLVKQFGQPIDGAALQFYLAFLRDPSVALQRFVTACATVAGLGAIAVLLLAILHRRPRIALAALALFACLDPFLVHVYAYRSRHPYDAIELPKALKDAVEPLIARSQQAGEIPWRVILHPDFSNRTHFLDGFWEPAGYDPLMPRGANNRIVLTGSVGTPMDARRRQLIASATGRRFDLSWWSALQQDTLTTQQLSAHQFAGAQFASIERNVVAGAPPTDCFGPDMKGTTFVVPPRFAFCEVEARQLSSAFRETISAIASARSTSDSLPLQSSLEPGENLGMKPMRTPNGYTFNVTLSKPALLMLRTTWLPGWNVRVDGGKAGKTLCANHWMPAVAVPAGTHEIRFYYRPPHFRAAAAVSVLTCLVIIGGLFARQRARRFEAATT